MNALTTSSTIEKEAARVVASHRRISTNPLVNIPAPSTAQATTKGARAVNITRPASIIAAAVVAIKVWISFGQFFAIIVMFCLFLDRDRGKDKSKHHSSSSKHSSSHSSSRDKDKSRHSSSPSKDKSRHSSSSSSKKRSRDDSGDRHKSKKSKK